jgi:hypothetical protein
LEKNGHRIRKQKRVGARSVHISAPWDRARICEALRELDRRKTPLWSRSIRQSHPKLYAAARHWFGMYSQAIAAAGLDYKMVRQMEPGRWNRKTVAAELRKMHRQKIPMHHAAIDRERGDLMLAAYRYYGSYKAAVEAAGLSYDRIRVRKMPSWDKKRVLARLRQFKEGKTRIVENGRSARRNPISIARPDAVLDLTSAPPNRLGLMQPSCCLLRIVPGAPSGSLPSCSRFTPKAPHASSRQD